MNQQEYSTNDPTHKKVELPILLVDDDYNLRQSIQWMLEDEGFTVQTAADGQEAVEQAKQQRPALVVLDMGLPLLNGAEVAREIRSEYGDTISFILITADGNAEAKSRQIGATTYLRKPFAIDHLIDAIQKVLP